MMSLNKIAAAIADILPGDLSDEVRKSINIGVQSVLEKMDLVTREEFEVQEKVLARTRQKLEVLEERMREIEKMGLTESERYTRVRLYISVSNGMEETNNLLQLEL